MIFYEIQNVYFEHISSKDLKNVLDKNLEEEEFYSFILHDRDTKPSGDIKKAHFHLIIGVNRDNKVAKMRAEMLANLIYDKTIVKNVRNVHKAICYLVHKFNPEKYQYNSSEIVTNNIEVVDEYLACVPKSNDCEIVLQEFIDTLLSCEKKPSLMEVLIFFKKRNMLSYYIQHQKNIENVMMGIFYENKPFSNCDEKVTQVCDFNKDCVVEF